MKVIIALPGRDFSNKFLQSWSETLVYLVRHGYEVSMVNEYSSFVPFSRMKPLGLDVLRGKDQNPFDGRVDYDVWMTIDSDMVFTPAQVEQLLQDCKQKHPVVSGLYKMVDMKHFAAVEHWDMDHFLRHGTFQFMTSSDVRERYQKVSYNGMGFFACRRGGIESLKYPYFHYGLQKFGNLVDMCSEDVAFCKNLQDAGYDVVVNTDLVIGHEKSLVI